MSWTGIKKAINRAGAQVMLKAGQIEESVDREYDFEEKRYRQMEVSSNKLQKELRHYLESLRILSNAQVNIGEVLSEFYGPEDVIEDKSGNPGNSGKPANPGFSGIHGTTNNSNKYLNFSQEYFHVMKNLHEKSLGDLESPFHQTVLNPIARFNSYYIEINEAIKKRNHKKIDYDSMKTKVRKLIEKPVQDRQYEAKLELSQTQLAQLEANYDVLNTQLKLELPKLVDLRTPFLDPSFEAFVKLQLRFFNDNYHQLNDLQVKLDAKTREDYVSGSLDDKIDGILVKMRELNITNAS